MDIRRGSALGRYIVIDPLGGGAMGVVYAGYDPELDRRVALKVLRPRAEAAPQRQQHQDLLVREAQAVARLQHANVVSVYDVGVEGSDVFMAMELVDGCTLAKWLETRRDWRATRNVFAQAAHGLAAAHAAGLVHRDFKPSNVMIGKDGRARVTDFGLARDLPDEAGEPASAPGSTRTGALAGTPAYMAPEQHRGHAADARSDQFSFSVALYEALYGGHPFARDPSAEGGTHRDSDDLTAKTALALDIVSGRMREPPTLAGVPAWLKKVVLRGLAAAPEDRYPSMKALLADLERDPDGARRRWFFALAAAPIVASAIALRLAAPRTPEMCRDAEQHLSGVWGDKERASLRAAFVATGNSDAQAIATRAQAEIDARMRAWVTQRTDACEATHKRGEQSGELLDLRMECLDRRLADTQAAIGVLMKVDARGADRSIDVLQGLEPLDACANGDALKTRTPLPRDPATRARIDEVSRRVAEARALQRAGRFADGLEVAKAQADLARAIGYAPLTAQALYAHADLMQKMGKVVDAVPVFLEAARVADEGRDDRLRARIWVQLAYLESERSNIDLALEYGERAKAALNRFGGDADVESERLQVIGETYAGTGDLQKAEDHLRRALAIETRAFGEESRQAGRTLATLASALSDQGRYEEALDAHKRSLGILERTLGATHPILGSAINNEGEVYVQLGDLGAAKECFERSLTLKERSLGKDSPRIAATLTNLADVLRLQRNEAEALARYERAVGIYTRAFGEDNPKVADPLVGMGEAHLALDEAALALPLLERAVRLRDPAKVPPLALGNARYALARAQWDAGRDKAEASALARTARDDFAHAGKAGAARQREAQAWLDSHE